MSGWTGNIERATLDNDTFRTVVATGAHLQLVVMSLAPGEEIGLEVHHDRDQFLRVEEGAAMVTLGPDDEVIEKTIALGEDWACIIPALLAKKSRELAPQGGGFKAPGGQPMVVAVILFGVLTAIFHLMAMAGMLPIYTG